MSVVGGVLGGVPAFSFCVEEEVIIAGQLMPTVSSP
jgi:hypothetical protein